MHSLKNLYADVRYLHDNIDAGNSTVFAMFATAFRIKCDYCARTSQSSLIMNERMLLLLTLAKSNAQFCVDNAEFTTSQRVHCTDASLPDDI